MSRLTNHLFILILALGLFALGTISAKSQPPPATDQKNVFMITQEVLRTFYAEVFGKGWYFNVSTSQPIDDDRWGEFSGLKFKITRFSPGTSFNATFDAKTGKALPQPGNTIFLEGTTWAGRAGQITQFFTSGQLAHSQQNDTIHQLIESHPEWSEVQQIVALKQAGARYGPADKSQFLDTLHLEKAETIFGRLRITLVEFNLPSPNHEGSFAAGALNWAVHAEAELTDGTHAKYAFGFEPFEGKLISIHRMN